MDRTSDAVWHELDVQERVWRAFAWGWSHYIRPARVAQLRAFGDRGYRLLEPEDLMPPWTPQLMLDANRLCTLSAEVNSGYARAETKAEAKELRRKFLGLGVTTMEDFFDE